MKRFWAVGVLAMVLSLLVVACGGGDDEDSTLRIGLASFFRETLDKSQDTVGGVDYSGHMYDFLVGIDEDGDLDADFGLATAWRRIDPQTYELDLREDVEWHDGEDFTAADVKFTFDELFASEGSACQACPKVRATLDNVEVVDDHKVRFHLKSPDLFWIEFLSPRGFGDAAIMAEHGWREAGGTTEGWNENPVGTGPWVFVERTIGQSIRFERNDDYWNEDLVPTYKNLVITLVEEESARLSQVERGELNMAQSSPQSLADIRAAGLTIRGHEDGVNNFFAFLQSDDPGHPTNNPDVRKALAIAVDMDAVVAAIYPPPVGKRSPNALISPLHEGSDPGLQPYPYNPDEARRLLQQSGHDGFKLVMWQYDFPGSPELPDLTEAVAGYFVNIGVDVEVTPVDIGTVGARWTNRTLGASDGPASMGPFNSALGDTLSSSLQIFAIGQDAGGFVATGPDLEGMSALYNRYLGETNDSARQALALEIAGKIYNEYHYIPVSYSGDVWASGSTICEWPATRGSVHYHRFEMIVPCG